jgi:Zinc knuckle
MLTRNTWVIYASGWVIDEKEHRGYRDPPEVQSAFVTDTVLVAKAKATLDSTDKKPSGKERRRRPLSEVTCYCCNAKGHYARDCKLKPKSEDAMLTYGISESSDSENETAYMTTDVIVSRLSSLGERLQIEAPTEKHQEVSAINHPEWSPIWSFRS